MKKTDAKSAAMMSSFLRLNLFRQFCLLFLLLLVPACQNTEAMKDQPARQDISEVSPTSPLDESEEPVVVAPEPETVVVPETLLDEDGHLKVALLLPLSGPAKPLGQALLESAQLSLFDLGEDTLELVIRDTRGNQQGARVAAQEALEAGAKLIIGPLFSSSVGAVAPLAREKDVPVIAFSNDTSVAGEGVYLMGVSPEQEIARVLNYAYDHGLRRFAIMSPDNNYGTAVLEAAQQVVAQNDSELVKVVIYNPALPDLSHEAKRLGDYDERRIALLDRRRKLTDAGDEASLAALRRLEDLDTLGQPPFDALLLPSGNGDLLKVASLLPFYDVSPDDVRFLGTRLWDDGAIGTEPALVDGWYVALPHETWQLFAKRFQDTYGRKPPRLASLAYDATAIAVVLLKEAKAQKKIKAYGTEELTRETGFSGVDGLFRFLPDGRSQRLLAVFEVQRNAPRVIDAPSSDFQPQMPETPVAVENIE